MKLIVMEKGDSSVGIPERYYEIDCPFERDEVDDLDLEDFKTSIDEAYLGYAERKLEIFYDFENQFIDEP